MKRIFSLLVTALVVSSAISTGIGSVTAQSATYEKTFTGEQTMIGVDTGNYTGSYTMQVTAHDGPGNESVTLYQEDHDTSAASRFMMFMNDGAYSNISVELIPASGGSGSPEFVDGSELPTVGEFQRVATTGGDADLICDPSEEISQAVVPGRNVVDCGALPGSTQVNTTNLDAQETRIEIYQSGQNSKASAQNTKTVLDNYLTDTRTQARIIGKNAYVRSLNNGDSESAARTAAKSAVADYYTTKQVNLINEWETQIAHFDYLDSTADTSVSSTFVQDKGYEMGSSDWTHSKITGYGTETRTLVNGTSMSVTTVQHTVYDRSVQGDPTSGVERSHSVTQTISSGPIPAIDATGSTSYSNSANETDTAVVAITGGEIRPPDSNYDYLNFFGYTEWANLNTKISEQNTQVQSEMDTLVTNTYTEYQQGEINNSDLVDPYVLASQQSPGEDFQGWANAQLTLLGTNSPENYEQIGSFEITTNDSQTYQGVLHASESPPSGEFAVGKTYDPSQVTGPVYFVTTNEIKTLDSNFTIQNITSRDGESLKNATIDQKTYDTANVTDLIQLYEDLAEEQAEIEARRQALQASGGGALFGSSSNTGKVVLIGAVLLLLYGREQNNGGRY